MKPLPVRRVAVTVPPWLYFHGIARAMFDCYRRALVELGLDVFEVPVEDFLAPDAARLHHLIDGIRAFRPEIALGLPKGAYILLCNVPGGRDGKRHNLFTDILDIPTVCLWDYAPLELADQLLQPRPASPVDSRPGAMAELTKALRHPRLIHWSADRGQTALMLSLGLLSEDRVVHEFPSALLGIAGAAAPAGPHRAGFIGHLYQQEAAEALPELECLAARAVAGRLQNHSRSLWNALEEGIAEIDPQTRRQLALDRDQTFFWAFAHRLILHRAQTVIRLHMLAGAGVPVACYGNLDATAPEVPAHVVSFPGNIPFGDELAACLARHEVMIDVFNPGALTGYSHKPVLCFAAGGFMLVDHKQDFVDVFGGAGEAVSYRDAADLAAKLDRFLANPSYRAEVAGEIRGAIRDRFQTADVLSRVIAAAAACPTAHGPRPRPATRVADLLPALRHEPHWTAASVEHLDDGAVMRTPAGQWHYAAHIPIPGSVVALNEPHVRLAIQVDSGRIGIAPLDERGGLTDEQYVGPSAHPVHVTVELPRRGVVSVMFRNAAETTSRALVREALLLDRQSPSGDLQDLLQ